jgi:hypothetical protein
LIVGSHEVARVHHQRTGASCDRRPNRGVLQLDFRVFDGGAISTHDGIESRGGGAGRITLLARTDAALDEVFHSLRDDFGVGCLRSVARQVRFGLVQRCFERPVIECEEHLPFAHVVALLEIDGLQLACHLRPHGDGRKGLYGADDVDVERHLLFDYAIDGDGHRGRRGSWVGGLSVACRARRQYHARTKKQAEN